TAAGSPRPPRQKVSFTSRRVRPPAPSSPASSSFDHPGTTGRKSVIRRTVLSLAGALLAAGLAVLPAVAQEDFIIVQSTTSTQNSGLFDHLLPMFEDKTGIEVRVVAVGTGQAIKNAANGDGDVLLVHAKP